MPEVMHSLVSDARKNRFSSIPKLSEEDIIRVWDSVSEYVELQMCSQRGVCIPNLGTFTFTLRKMEIGNNKFILVQRPVFVLSEKFSQTHALQYAKYHTTGEIPVVQLNFTAIAVESMFDRDTVEMCVREVLQSLSRAVSNQQSVEFLFRGIGVLSIKECKVKMRFFKDFLNSMDGSGNLIKVMENRPGTADSVMSTQTTLSAQKRPGTNTLTLPKLNGTRDLLPPITEHAADEGDGDKLPLPPSRSSNRETIHPHQVVGVSLNSDELCETQAMKESPQLSPSKKITTAPSNHSPAPPKTPPKPSPRRISETSYFVEPYEISDSPNSEASRPVSAPLHAPEPPSKPIKETRIAKPDITNCLSPKHHHKSGQDLCYLCMQRAMRNVPVSFEKERKRKELEQDALLQQYQQMKDHEAMLIDKANQNSNRQTNQKVAAFNLGVSECIRDAKHARSGEFVKSYIFQHRPLTPLRFYKQEEYNKALESQVKLRLSRESREKNDREFQERLEQVQLAEDLAAQREQFLRVKADQISQYQKALTAQIRSKPLPMPKAEPDSKGPIFGRHDATNEKLLDQKERSRTLLQSQLDMVSAKKKKIIMEQLTKQKEESEMLERTKEELLADRIATHKRANDMRLGLEKNWREHHQNKLIRENEDKIRLRTPGMMVLEQTDKYKRCGQCNRKTTNCGESNIWSESRYIPGSRLMV